MLASRTERDPADAVRRCVENDRWGKRRNGGVLGNGQLRATHGWCARPRACVSARSRHAPGVGCRRLGWPGLGARGLNSTAAASDVGQSRLENRKALGCSKRGGGMEEMGARTPADCTRLKVRALGRCGRRGSRWGSAQVQKAGVQMPPSHCPHQRPEEFEQWRPMLCPEPTG